MRRTVVVTSAAVLLALGCAGDNERTGAPVPDVGANIGAGSIATKVEGTLAADLERSSDGRFDALVWLAAEANIGAATAAARTKDEKNARVFEALVRTADASQADLTAWLRERGVEHVAHYLGNVVVVEQASAAVLRAIAARPDVRRVSENRTRVLKLPPEVAAPDGIVTLPNEPGGPVNNLVPMEPGVVLASTPGANVTSTGATRVWSELGVRGAGIVVGGQDTGVEWTHAALKGKYRGWNGTTADHRYSWHDAIRTAVVGGSSCGVNQSTPCDDNGHGTHTLATVAGDDGTNGVGMAPGAKWIACRNMDRGSGRPSTYIECFEFFLAPYPQGGNARTDGLTSMAPHVINNSWGCNAAEGCSGGEIKPVLDAMKAAGIMVVASAGNEGSSCRTISSQPATVSGTTLSVGAHDHRTGGIASFSSRGPSALDNQIGPDISAPGVSIRSAVRSGRYSSMSGTSMAGPHVVGAVALLWSADPTLVGNIDETVNVLRASAKAKTTSQSCGGVSGSSVPNNTYGWGLLDVYSAVRQRVPAR